MGMKIINDALKKLKGPLPRLHEELIRRGFTISYVALWKLQTGKSKVLKPKLQQALVDIAYDGDWAKYGESLNSDLTKKKGSE